MIELAQRRFPIAGAQVAAAAHSVPATQSPDNRFRVIVRDAPFRERVRVGEDDDTPMARVIEESGTLYVHKHLLAEMMMPWPQDHKSRTRRRIVQAAAAAFRAGGTSRVRVEDIMARAGLTQGGFYAHFSSKDDVLRESLDYASGQTLEMLSKPLARTPAAGRFQAVVDAYLSAAHVAHPELGCPLASLGPEIARAGGRPLRSLAGGAKNRIAWMRQLLTDSQCDNITDSQVVGTMATMIGGVILARTLTDKASALVLTACREFLRPTFGESMERAAAQPTKLRRKRRPTARATRGPSARSAARRMKA